MIRLSLCSKSSGVARVIAVLLCVALVTMIVGCGLFGDDDYIGNANTKVFHCESCSYLPDSQNRVYFDSRDEAIKAGYRPCGHCEP